MSSSHTWASVSPQELSCIAAHVHGLVPVPPVMKETVLTQWDQDHFLVLSNNHDEILSSYCVLIFNSSLLGSLADTLEFSFVR